MSARRLLVAALALLAGLLALRRRRPAERVRVEYADGSSLTLEPGSADGDRLLALAREAVGA